MARTVCYWTRDLPAGDVSLARSFGSCLAGGSGRDASGAGRPLVRGVCCPGLFATTPTTAAVTTSRPSTSTKAGEPSGAVTNWWQTTAPATTTTTTKRTTTTRPTSAPSADITQWWQTTAGTTQRPSTSSAGTTVSRPTAPTIPPIITHPWQSTSTPSPIQVTGWWQTTAGATTTTSTTTTTTTSRGPATTAWWDVTTKVTSSPSTPAAAVTTKPTQDFSACGTRNLETDRIVGGQEATPGEFPWIAGIFKGRRQFCGGSLIDETHILTAAHCVAHMTSYDVRRLVVRLGDHDISTPDERSHEEYQVARIIRHKGFSDQTLHTDIALLTLTEPVKYRDHIRPVCMAEGSNNYTGNLVTVAGWGTLSEAGRQPDKLQKVDLKVWKNAECAASYGSSAPGGIISSMLCASRDGKDSCSGDSGGPLMIVEGGLVYQVGVVSWGIGCAKPEYPGVYTRVTSLRDWIERNRKAY
ncbi:transmembrane protease serine 9-like isoform X4 [Pollicipes pollicipes]|nr:transmembrane protease serine 9-like isoform X4 [Pollicipes pollicipes]